MGDSSYLESLKARMKDRVEFVKSLNEKKNGYDALPADALEAIEKVYNECN